MKGYVYILLCSDQSFYTGNTKHLYLRLNQHHDRTGANYASKRLPIKLVYIKEYDRIDLAFKREKQIQGWSRKKKQALINNQPEELHELAKCRNHTSHIYYKPLG
jgi:putative endonuclease